MKIRSLVASLLVAMLPAVAFAQDAAGAAGGALGAGKTVGLDYFFNHQEKAGKQFHYIWDDTDKNSGFSKFGDVWKSDGAQITAVKEAPTKEDLQKLSVYIICCPSNEAKAPNGKPNYMTEESAAVIADWVNAGGVLLLMANDKVNCEFDHYNILCQKFGIKFNGDLRNTAPTHADIAHAMFHKDQLPDSPLFKGVSLIYMKEISTITVTPPAEALMTVDKEKEMGPGKDVIMATATVGKGFVFAVGDPWIYNEYIDNTKLTPEVQNRKAGENLAAWLLSKAQMPQTK